MDVDNHPCFNAEVRHTSGRIHLAVAPKCNVQCNFCNRKFDCANESRPGVTTSVMKPVQAVEYLSGILKRVDNLSVVGIAGPGEPFANPGETLETMERVRAAFPDKLLCVSSNGLALPEYVPRLAAIGVSHVTVTVNAVDTGVGANIYEWIACGKETYHGREGAEFLLENQARAIRLLKEHGILVKINTVVIPRVNEHHVPEISRYVAKLGADIQNCIPLIPVAGTLYESLEEPSPEVMRPIRAQASLHIRQMSHCARCRADAVGLLGGAAGRRLAQYRQERKIRCDFLKKPCIAVASSDGVSVNLHLGMAARLWIYRFDKDKVDLVETRRMPVPDGSVNRWDAIAELIPDCSALLVGGLGRAPYERLQSKGIMVESVEGYIREIAEALFVSGEIPRKALRLNECGAGTSCGGQGMTDCGF
ncbi:MAG: radical SAM protein [Dysgonamonadaceae bacterium]|jgi:nitrogen fixation protein NifB|nr:radical SAM protein [Dysgonamonadaceae bacterium]